MKLLLVIILVFFTSLSYSQTQYSEGFEYGYSQGYCYGQAPCNAPNPPLTPNPQLGESWDNYQQGYNRGFQMGIDAKRASGNNSYTSNPPSPQRQLYKPIPDNVLVEAAKSRYELAEYRIQILKEYIQDIWDRDDKLIQCEGESNKGIIQEAMKDVNGSYVLNSDNFQKMVNYLKEWQIYYSKRLVNC